MMVLTISRCLSIAKVARTEIEYYLDVSAERSNGEHTFPLRRYSTGEVRVEVSACRRNRLDTDICSETVTLSNPVELNAAASEYASINDSLCWNENSTGDGIVLTWNYDPPDDIPGQTFLIPSTYIIEATSLLSSAFDYQFLIDNTPSTTIVNEVSTIIIEGDPQFVQPGDPLVIDRNYQWTIFACNELGQSCQAVGYMIEGGQGEYPEERRCQTPPAAPDAPSSPAGGPGDLNPGVWLSPDLPRQGFTFYWASDLRYDTVHEEYGNTYDLFAYWQTYQYINGFYSPVWLYAKLRQLDADDQSYGGALYYPQNGATSPDIEAGYFIVNYDADDPLSASIDINMQLDGGLYTEGMVNFEINEITTDGVVPQVGRTNITDYNNGVWIDSNDSYKILSWQYNYLEGQIWLGFDNNIFNPRPIWANGVLDCRVSGNDCTYDSDGDGIPDPSNAQVPFNTVEVGLQPRLTPGAGDTVETISVGSLTRTVPVNALDSQPGLELVGNLNATLTGANGVDTRNISFSANEVLTKTASFHDIRYLIDGAENPSSCTLQNGYCELLLTWFSDDDFFDTGESSIRAYLTRDGIEQPLDVNSCQISDQPLPDDAFVVRDYVCQLTTTGSYQFLLKNRSGSDDENIIAVSPVLSVQPGEPDDDLPTGNPAVPPNAANIPYVPPPSLAQSSVGATAGSFNVDESGSATYQIPIITAPGSGGVVPQMALQYSSQAGNGVAGVGWSIGGTSAISRCGQTYVTDGNSTSVQLTDDDRLCLDGQRLIKVGGGTADYWSIDSEYLTEVDTLTRVRLLADVANGIPPYFTVERQDGSISYYGLTSDSLILAGGTDYTGDAVYAWAQSRFEDSAGNYIDYAYSHPNGGNNHNTPIEYYLDKARYTGNLRRGTEPNATIFFNNEPKNPAEIGIGYLAGAQLTSTERLKSITSSVQDDANPDDIEHLIRHYRLEYESDPYSRSLLTSLQECWHETDSSKCLEATIFVWDEHQQQISNGINADIASDFGSTAATRRIIDPRFADMNGDGQSDLIYLIKSGGANQLYVALSQPYLSSTDSPFNNISPPNNKHFYTEIQVPDKVRDRQLWQLLDYNNDGYLDIIYPEDGTWYGHAWNPTVNGNFNSLEVNIGDVRNDASPDQSKEPQTVKLADINGDGYNDLLYGFNNAELTININRAVINPSNPFNSPVIADLQDPFYDPLLGDVCTSIQSCTREITFKEQTEVFDHNGDGAVDILIQERLSIIGTRSNLSTEEAQFIQQHGYSFLSNETALQRDAERSGEIDATLWRVMIANGENGFDNGPAIARASDNCETGPNGVDLCDVLPIIKEDNHLYMVDLNGDSLADFVYQRCFNDSSSCDDVDDSFVDEWKHQYNTGNGFTSATSFGSSQLPHEADQVRFIDYDGNGITDVLWSEKDNDSDFERWQILLNHYNGFANASLANGPYSGKSRGEDLSLFADLTGNGKTDHLFFDYSAIGNDKDLDQLLVQRGVSAGGSLDEPYDYVAHNVISAIEDGLGAMTLISYKSLVQRSVYTRGSNARSLTAADNSPVLDIVPAYYVVADVTSTSPAYTVSIDSNQNVSAESSGDSSIEYYYAGAKIQGDGRGFLGFERLGTFDPQNRILTITDYYQDFPYIGAPYRTERYYLRDGFDPWPQSDAIDVVPPCGEPDGGCLTGGFDTSLTNNDNPRAVLLSESDQLMDARVTATGSITGKPILYPYIATSNEVSFAPIYDANQIPFDQDAVSTTKTTNSGYSIYGEVGQVVVEVLDAVGNTASKTTTVNSYADTNPALWHLGRLSRAVVTHQRPDISDEVRISEFDYHTETGQLIREIVEPNNTDLRITTTYTLDDFGNRTHTNVSGRGVNRTSRVVYDERGRYVIREINAMNQITMEVDTNQVTNLPEVDHFGNPLRVRNQQGVETEMAYDPMGRQYFTATAALGTYSTIYRYSNVGSACPANVEARWYEETFNYGAPTTRVCHDVLGREVRRSTQGFDGRWIHLDTRYNRTGQTSAVTEPYYQNAQVYWNHSVYDELDRPTAVISANGGLTTTEYSGLVTTIINPLEQSRTEYKNVLNETIEVIDAMGGVITYSYDAIGRLIATDGALPVDIDQTTMSYNKLGHKLTMNDPDKGLWEYRYNVLGEITCQRDARGMGSKLVYDNLGRVTGRTDYANLDINECSGNIRGLSTWEYNNEAPNPDSPPPPGYGQLRQSTSMNNGETIIKTYTYDVHGRSVESTTEIDGQSFTQRTTYDQHNRVFQQFDATGSDYGIQMQYNAQGYLYEQIEAHDSGESTIPDPVYLRILKMDARGNVTDQINGNGVTTIRAYDPDDGQLNLIQSSKDSGGDIQNLLYEFDLIGNLVSRIDLRQGQSEAFFYDDLNRLETVDLYADTDLTGNPLRTDSTFYDAAGNILSRTGGVVLDYKYGDDSMCEAKAMPGRMRSALLVVSTTATMPSAT